ncbi:hypothetical protein GOODEAATRI_014581 [Goodea atripinnis]|uniref:MAPK regulated corepressor interacting protein 2-like n=1 Tax=Goodea atripinnis TaxID=208336 RepID=A0ABV0NKL5_9TELE
MASKGRCLFKALKEACRGRRFSEECVYLKGVKQKIEIALARRWISSSMMYTITRGPSKLVTQRRTAWQEVVQQEEGQGVEDSQAAVYYKEATPGPHMDSFVPIDLDEWWAQRFLANIDKLTFQT